MNKIYMGIDVGGKCSVFHAIGKKGKPLVDGKRVPTNEEKAWRKLLSDLSEKNRLYVAFEMGPHYEWMYDLAKEYAEEVKVVDAARFNSNNAGQNKTDRLDAKRLAEGARRGDLPSVWVPDREQRADRRLVSFVHYSSQQLTSVKCRLRGLLTTFRLSFSGCDITSDQAREWLKREAEPRLDEDARLMLRMLLDEAELLRKQREELNQRVAERVKRYEDYKLLSSIPGFGKLTSLAVLCAVGSIFRFRTSRKLSAYFGVCPHIRQSGKKCRTGGMSRHGNVHVRWLLSQVLLHLHRKDAKARARYERLKRRKHKGVARGAMMRWLVSVLWHIWTKQEPYRIQKLQATNKRNGERKVG